MSNQIKITELKPTYKPEEKKVIRSIKSEYLIVKIISDIFIRINSYKNISYFFIGIVLPESPAYEELKLFRPISSNLDKIICERELNFDSAKLGDVFHMFTYYPKKNRVPDFRKGDVLKTIRGEHEEYALSFEDCTSLNKSQKKIKQGIEENKKILEKKFEAIKIIDKKIEDALKKIKKVCEKNKDKQVIVVDNEWRTLPENTITETPNAEVSLGKLKNIKKWLFGRDNVNLFNISKGKKGYLLTYEYTPEIKRVQMKCDYCKKLLTYIVTKELNILNTLRIFTIGWSKNPELWHEYTVFCHECFNKLRNEYFSSFDEYVWDDYVKGKLINELRYVYLKENFYLIRKKLGLPTTETCFCSGSELELRSILKKIFKRQEVIYNDRRVLEGKELDIYYPKLRLAFEYDGELHHRFIKYFHKTKTNFKKIIEKDKLKNKMCKEKGINLVRITSKDPLTEKFMQKLLRDKNII